MRVATMVISLVLMIVLFLQSCALFTGGQIANHELHAQGGAVGMAIALLFVIGAAFSMGVPIVSTIAFAMGGALGLMGANTTTFSDLKVWGWVSLVLAVLAYLGHREKKKVNRAAAKAA